MLIVSWNFHTRFIIIKSNYLKKYSTGTSKTDLIVKFRLDECSGFTQGRVPFLRRMQPIIWQMFEEPRSSKAATFIAAIQITMIVFSIAILWISSYAFAHHVVFEMNSEMIDPNVQNIQLNINHNIDPKNTHNITIISFRVLENGIHPSLIILDYITFAWFLVDLTVRAVVSPSKIVFFRNLDNLIDIFATAWLVIGSILKIYINSFILEASQVVRVLRLFRLLSYHSGLQVIITSIKRSSDVLQLLCLFLLLFSTLYGSLVFYAERLTTDDPNNNLFISIPNAFWYAIVSLTTIGYGDYAPITLLGRIFGSACVVTGVLMVGLPMTIVVEVFTNFYNHLRARSKLPKQRRRILPVEGMNYFSFKLL